MADDRSLDYRLQRNFLTVLLSVLLAGIALAFSSCATIPTAAGIGFIYTGVIQPAGQLAVDTDGSAGWSKKGESTCTNILGLVVTGDCSILEAMTEGGVTKIHHIDYEITNVLGLYSTKTTIVYGE